jgi:hypothetical protein
MSHLADMPAMGWRLRVDGGQLVLTKWGNPGPDRMWVCDLEPLPTNDQPAELIFRDPKVHQT